MFDIDTLKSSVPLHEVFTRYAGSQLRSLGSGKYTTLCTFHHEKTPSLHINDNDGYYYCFGCSARGDILRFMQDYRGVDFVDAAQTLADDFNLSIGTPGPDDTTPDSVRRAAIYAVNSDAEHAYARALYAKDTKTAAAQAKMREKHLAYNDVRDFGIGYARGGTWLYTQLKSRHSIDTLLDAGLVVRTDRGVRDRWHHRLMFSLRDPRGRVVGFAARKLDESDTGGKYINTPKTLVYNKSVNLYGIDRAKHEIRARRTAIIVEGPTDTLATACAGVTNVVASCGTAFGVGHLNTLRTVVGEGPLTVVFVFDGDTAGLTAMGNVWKNLRATTNVDLRGYLLPDGADPNDLWIGGRRELLATLAADSAPLAQLMIDRALAPLNGAHPTPETVSAASRAALAVLNGWADRVAAARYRSQIAERVGVDAAALPELVDPPTAPTARSATAESGDLEREALRLIAQHPAAASILAAIEPHVWTNPHHRDIHHYLTTLRRNHPDLPLHTAIDRGDSPDRDECFRLLMERTSITEQTNVTDYAQAVASMLNRRVHRREQTDTLEHLRQALTPDEQRTLLHHLFTHQRDKE